jgi:dipeptidyl aminopeptidase/acylaminoacyl peptidase
VIRDSQEQTLTLLQQIRIAPDHERPTSPTRRAGRSPRASPPPTDRVCIHGASYGGYAALMGVASEPELHRCASGYIGVYDLPMMHREGDVQERCSGETYLRDWVGEPAQLAAVSPVNLADRIRVPVLLAAGGEDGRAPVQHTERMERALKQAGVAVETVYHDTEGHGFCTFEHRRDYYVKLVGFLRTHLGPVLAAAP